MIDTGSGTVTATTPVGEYPGAGQYPQAVTIAPDGRYAVRGEPADRRGDVIDTGSDTPGGQDPDERIHSCHPQGRAPTSSAAASQ